ncbi:CYP2U1 [Lepeophtheirus salmonis]|uniref:CYP2U1 n=1 Tax=Lepeophtheirus salmonis TaxID=72036 RepID=A0A7R8D1N9_LEPSM|nr:CYP2U1 [Lepeophtheirus salmonis]CAF2970867.1 CYP2U1 [Lepeophtheirus salmonis]
MNGIGTQGCLNPDYRKFGDLYTLFIGPIPLIVINSFQGKDPNYYQMRLTKELYVKEEISSRRDTWWTINVRGDGKQSLGIINTGGMKWQTQRRFALRQLREFGFGKRSLDSVIQEEAQASIDTILQESSKNDGKVLMASNFNVSIINVLWQIVAGQRFDPEESSTKERMEHLNEVFRVGYSVLHYLPIARYFIKKDERRDKMLSLKEFFREMIREHIKDQDDDNPRDFIDVYLKEIQKKCKEEIKDKLQGDEKPTQDCISELPYTHATLMEVQRLASVGPMSLPRYTTKDIDVNGYSIPEGTEIYSNFMAFHRDPDFFPEPLEFKPERFLTEDGSRVKKDEHFLPFGLGRRICMGESLARHQLIIFFIMILQNLNISVPIGQEKPDPESCFMGITRIPTPFHVQIRSVH